MNILEKLCVGTQSREVLEEQCEFTVFFFENLGRKFFDVPMLVDEFRRRLCA